MFDYENLCSWIDSTHDLYELFEGRFDLYSLSRKWVEQIYRSKMFSIDKKDRERLRYTMNNINYNVFRNKKDYNYEEYIKKIRINFEKCIVKYFDDDICEMIGFSTLPYIFYWNFQRFKKYFYNKKDFDLEQYFIFLSNYVEENLDKFIDYSKLVLYDDDVEKYKILGFFKDTMSFLSKMGIQEREPIQTIKLLHIFAPKYFPLLDNKIAYKCQIKRKDQGINGMIYIDWMKKIREFINMYKKDDILDLETKHGSSILKLIDEGLYLMCSVNLSKRLPEIGL